jgi:hypothetical protein
MQNLSVGFDETEKTPSEKVLHHHHHHPALK